MGLAEIPAVLAVRRLGRGPVANLVAALAVAQPQLGRPAALVAVGPPARETPVVRSLLLRHCHPDRKIAPPLRAKRCQRTCKPGSVLRRSLQTQADVRPFL